MSAVRSPGDRIRLIERSLRCFVFGLLSLIPLLGLGPAILAIHLHFKVWSESGAEWNPGRRYAIAGFCLAWIGLLLSLGDLALFVLALIEHFSF